MLRRALLLVEFAVTVKLLFSYGANCPLMFLLNFVRFHVQRAIALHPFLVSAFSLATVGLLFSIGYFISQQAALRSAIATSVMLSGAKTVAPDAVPVGAALPEFHTVPLVRAIVLAAEASETSVSEIKFAFEDSATQPFVRYRASFSLVGKYFGIRAFIEDVRSALPFAYLDALHCSREDAGVTEVTCEMTITAVYSRKQDG
jgi:hypothetical protein